MDISTVQFKSCQENNIFTPIYHHQNYITKIIHKSGVTHPERILALITGDTSLIDEYYKSNIKDIGIYHLLAISGTHVGTIIVLVYQLLVRLNIPLVLIKGVTILLLLISTLFILDLYLVPCVPFQLQSLYLCCQSILGKVLYMCFHLYLC